MKEQVLKLISSVEDDGIDVLPGYGGGTGPILLNDVQCNGKETTLSECSSVSVYNCVHNNDVGVRCFRGKFYCDMH